MFGLVREINMFTRIYSTYEYGFFFFLPTGFALRNIIYCVAFRFARDRTPFAKLQYIFIVYDRT